MIVEEARSSPGWYSGNPQHLQKAEMGSNTGDIMEDFKLKWG